MTAHHLLYSGNVDLHRISFHRDRIINSAVILLQHLNNLAGQERPPDEWLYASGRAFASLLMMLQEAEAHIGGEYVNSSLAVLMKLTSISLKGTIERLNNTTCHCRTYWETWTAEEGD